jgi:hypothetical protein
MAIKLNGTSGIYKEFYGKNIEQMPLLIAESRVPMSVSQIMQKKLDVRNAEAEVRNAWMNNSFDTDDAIIYHPNGDVKIVLDSINLREMTPESKINHGALVLTYEVYKALPGVEFNEDEIGKIEYSLSKSEVKHHPIWRLLARDSNLLNDYVDYIFNEYEKRFDDDTFMGIFPRLCNGDYPEMRSLRIKSLEDGSHANGWSDLDYDKGLLVGITKYNLYDFKKPDVKKRKKLEIELDNTIEFKKPNKMNNKTIHKTMRL